MLMDGLLHTCLGSTASAIAISLAPLLWQNPPVLNVHAWPAKEQLPRNFSIAEALPMQQVRPLPMAFFSITEVYPPRLRTEEKRQHLTPPAVDAYNRVINSSGILSPEGPLHLIDMHHLTQGGHLLTRLAVYSSLLHLLSLEHAMPAQCNLYSRLLAAGSLLILVVYITAGCGPSCTHDGLHYSNTTYDLAVQIFANTVSVEHAE